MPSSSRLLNFRDQKKPIPELRVTLVLVMDSRGDGRQESSRPVKTCSLRSLGPRASTISQGTIQLLLILSSAHFHWAESKRNESLTWFETPSPWNKTYSKIERKCMDFHSASETTNYFYWPEGDPQFDHCCDREDQNWTYGIYGPNLGYATYYDLGLIDRCLPFWRCNDLYGEFYRIMTFYIRCERTDLERLWARRFWYGSVLKYGLLLSALPFVVSSENLFGLSALYCSWRRNGRRIVKETGTLLLGAVHGTDIIVWIHLYLLAINGNGLLEAVGRQNPYHSQSKSFYNYARLYVALSVLVWVSPFLQQLSYWVALMEDLTSLPSQLPSTTSTHNQIIARRPSVLVELKADIGLNSDWVWQPIAAQAVILFCLWGFLTYVDDKNSMAGGCVWRGSASGSAVEWALRLENHTQHPWSGLFALKIILNTVRFLSKRINNGLKADMIRFLFRRDRSWRWRSQVIIIRRSRSLSRPNVPPEDPAARLAGGVDARDLEGSNTPENVAITG